MKQNYLFICLLFLSLATFSQGYEFALVHDGDYAFSVTATPDFDATSTDVSDIGFALMLPAGTSDVTTLSQFNGRMWSATEVTAAQLSGLSLGDGTRDGFAMNLPPGQTILSHTSGVAFTLVSFEVSNMPNSGLLQILANTDPIAIGLGGAVDSFYNSNIDETTTQNYFAGLAAGSESFSFSTLGLNEVTLQKASVTVFPNPASDFITVESNLAIKSIEFYDLLGKRVLTASQTNVVELEQLPAGVYLLKINSTEGSLTKRLVVK
jgi:hypothetical protein